MRSRMSVEDIKISVEIIVPDSCELKRTSRDSCRFRTCFRSCFCPISMHYYAVRCNVLRKCMRANSSIVKTICGLRPCYREVMPATKTFLHVMQFAASNASCAGIISKIRNRNTHFVTESFKRRMMGFIRAQLE